MEQTPMILFEFFIFFFIYRKSLETTNELQKESEMVCSNVFLLSVKLIKYFFKTFGTDHKSSFKNVDCITRSRIACPAVLKVIT